MEEGKRAEIITLKSGYFKDFDEWYRENDIEHKVLRYWTSEQLLPDAELPECNFGYITQIIDKGNDCMVGFQVPDYRYESGKFPYVDYFMLSDLALAYAESDQE